ncbi:uncharacterized protein LOC100368545 [Saccoglossus kowalevskii]|uniref:D-aminoacyl-tRNA deacylase n=1 Tax=Saccoglossus kowalevskii TaxID=10224 RepID=A0ABM0H0F3_SACKO|nr:PREDICTED: D-tyrosyl-tRNA(Tyr) deacylase 1-like [Saccoglossus kowalevskii]
MRAIVQRVMKASVTVGDDLVSSIGRGLCVLVGISKDDTKKEIEFMVRKILNLRIFDGDDQKRWMKSVKDKNYEILCISQFTLCCTLKGNKPDYHLAMGADNSQQFYEEFLAALRKAYKPELIKDGEFGAYMQVNIQNDGPVTIPIDSPPPKESPDKPRTPKTPVAVVKPESKKKNITADHAVSFVDKVRSSFHGNPEFYEHFLDIMKDVRNQSIDTLTVVYRIGVLFKGRPELIHDFNLFLPSNYRLYIDSGDVSKITVIIDGDCSMSLDALAEQIEKNISTGSPSSEAGAVGGESTNSTSSEVDSILLNEVLSRLGQQH